MDEQAVDVVARALCKACNFDLEATLPNGDHVVNWVGFRPQARTHIVMHDALSQYLREKVLGAPHG